MNDFTEEPHKWGSVRQKKVRKKKMGLASLQGCPQRKGRRLRFQYDLVRGWSTER